MPQAPSRALVSVIVRTMGRPELARALDSVAAHGLRPLEIGLVDAAGAGLTLTAHGGVPVRVVSGARRDRPNAANAGLEAASGDWLLILDEDDEIEPGHLAQLLATAQSARLPVAYSQTKLIDASGKVQRVFGGPFDRLALFRSNYLQFCAVLFNRSFVEQGLRFDTSYPIFEDWDFWLQLAMRTPFAFTGMPTARYHAAIGQSGAGSGGNLDREAVLAQRNRLMRKWEAAQTALLALR